MWSPLETSVPAPAANSLPDGTQTPAPAALPPGRLLGRPTGLIPSRNGLWAINPDGIRVTLLTSDPIVHLSVSPSGWAAAYITSADPEIFTRPNAFGYTLKFITLYDQRTYTITGLDPPGLTDASPQAVLDSAFQAVQAFQRGALAWSPDGLQLAFPSLHEASADQPASSNIYLYSLGSGNLRRLTTLQLPQGPAHPYNLSWSPFGESVYYAVAYNFGSAAGAGAAMAGAWIDRLDGLSIQVAAGENTGGEQLLAWQTSGTFLLSSWNSDCGDQNLRKVHLHGDMRGIDVTPLWPKCYTSAQYNPQGDELLINVHNALQNTELTGSTTPQPGALTDPTAGLYQISVSNAQARALSNQGFERVILNPVKGSGGSRPSWFGYTRGAGLFSIQRSGTVELLFTGPPFDGSSGPAIQPLFPLSNGDWLWAGDGLYLCRPGYPPQPIMDVPVNRVTSSPFVDGLYYFLAPEKDAMQLFAVRAGDWQPFILDEGMLEPRGVDWAGR